MLFRRESTFLKFPKISLHTLRDLRGEIAILLDKLGRKFFKETQHIVDNQHLTVTIRAGTDADDGYSDFLGNNFRQWGRDSLQDNPEDPGRFQRSGPFPPKGR